MRVLSRIHFWLVSFQILISLADLVIANRVALGQALLVLVIGFLGLVTNPLTHRTKLWMLCPLAFFDPGHSCKSLITGRSNIQSMTQESSDVEASGNTDSVVDFDGKKMLVVKAAVVSTKPWRRGKR